MKDPITWQGLRLLCRRLSHQHPDSVTILEADARSGEDGVTLMDAKGCVRQFKRHRAKRLFSSDDEYRWLLVDMVSRRILATGITTEPLVRRMLRIMREMLPEIMAEALQDTPADKASVKTYLDIIKELAAKRREEVKAQEQTERVEWQKALQERLTLWDPVLQVVREAQAGYPGWVAILNQNDKMQHLAFVVDHSGVGRKDYALVVSSEHATFEVVRAGTLTTLAKAPTVEGLIPFVVDLLAQSLAAREE